MITLYVQSPTLYLAGSGIVIGATSATVTDLVDIYGNVLTMADFGSVGYITFEPDTSNAEAGTFTGVTANANGTYTLTGLKTLLAKSPYTETSGAVRNHAGGTKVVITDNVGFWNTFVDKNNDSTVVGQVTFPNGAKRPVLDADTDTATAAAVVTYGQLARTAIAGGAAASTTLLGYVKVSTNPVSALSPIAVGDNDTRVPTQAENDALAGESGTSPSSANKFIDAQDLVGIVSPFAGSAAPTGWLICDGSAVSRTTYSRLFTVISTTYGTGDGSSTFNVPDLRGRHAVGAGTGTKVATFSSRSGNVITVTGLSNASNNEFQTGQAIVYVTSGSVITGLTSSTTYYVVRITNTTFSLATSLANAQNGTVITLSSDGSGTQTFTQTLTSRTAGHTGGEETHAISSTELLAHTHNVGGGANTSTAGGDTVAAGSGASATSGSTGGNAAMNIMNPFVVLNYIIKY